MSTMRIAIFELKNRFILLKILQVTSLIKLWELHSGLRGLKGVIRHIRCNYCSTLLLFLGTKWPKNLFKSIFGSLKCQFASKICILASSINMFHVIKLLKF